MSELLSESNHVWSGFKIAFAMLDQDGNERIEKEEFKVLETVFSSAARERKTQQLTEEEDTDTLAAGTYINIFQLHN